MGSIRKMYEEIRVAIGPTTNKVAPLKSATGKQLTDKKKQMERWVEHYSDLYSKERHESEQLEDLSIYLATAVEHLL